MAVGKYALMIDINLHRWRLGYGDQMGATCSSSWSIVQWLFSSMGINFSGGSNQRQEKELSRAAAVREFGVQHRTSWMY